LLRGACVSRRLTGAGCQGLRRGRFLLVYVVHCSWFWLDLSHPRVKLLESLEAGGQHAICSVGRMPELKRLGGCSGREASGLEPKICWFSSDLRKYSVTAGLKPWRRSATILSREAVMRTPPGPGSGCQGPQKALYVYVFSPANQQPARVRPGTCRAAFPLASAE
jgi:hypothetical protein